jgi:hypothetical protein
VHDLVPLANDFLPIVGIGIGFFKPLVNVWHVIEGIAKLLLEGLIEENMGTIIIADLIAHNPLRYQ